MTTSRTSDPKYQAMRAQTIAESTVCWLCLEPLYPELKWPDPMSSSFDHMESVADGADNLSPGYAAHLDCNRKRQRKPMEQVLRERPSRHSRSW